MYVVKLCFQIPFFLKVKKSYSFIQELPIYFSNHFWFENEMKTTFLNFDRMTVLGANSMQYPMGASRSAAEYLHLREAFRFLWQIS